MTVIESLERSLQELPEDERDQLGRTFVKVVRVVKHLQATSEHLPDDERRAWFQQLNEAFEGFARFVVVYGQRGSGKSHALTRVLRDMDEPAVGGPSLAELEKLNTANRFEQWRQAIRESLSTAELESSGVSRQQLEQWRKRRKLIGLQPPFERGFVYPVWEFDEDARPHELIPQLVEAAGEVHLDPLSLHRLMVSETATPHGPLMKSLKAGEDDYVLDVIRAAGAQGS
jgi:hypothetical protein